MSMKCKVVFVEQLARNTYKIVLNLEKPIIFKAGQYLMVEMGSKDMRPFSIVNSPKYGETKLELHIGAFQESRYASEVIDMMKAAYVTQDDISIDAPHGEAWIRKSQRALLLIAGGTGFSYIHSILDYCIKNQWVNPIYLYWGAKNEEQLYAMQKLIELDRQHDNFHFIPVVEEQTKGWEGKVGNVLQSIDDDFKTLNEFDIYIAGRFELAIAAKTLFVDQKQVLAEHLFSDAYSFI